MMHYNKLAIFDRDQTLVTTVSGNDFPKTPTDLKPLPGVREKLKALDAMGYCITIASNQQGANFVKSMSDTVKEMMHVHSMLPMIKCAMFAPRERAKLEPFGVLVNFDEYSVPYELKMGHGKYVKPGSGMLLALVEKFKSDYLSYIGDPMEMPDSEPLEVMFVGDMPSDREAAENLDIKFIDAAMWLGDPTEV